MFHSCGFYFGLCTRVYLSRVKKNNSRKYPAVLKPAKFIYLFNFLEMLILSSNPAKNSQKYFDLEALKDKTL